MAGIDEGVVQVRADDEDEFTEGGLVLMFNTFYWLGYPDWLAHAIVVSSSWFLLILLFVNDRRSRGAKE